MTPRAADHFIAQQLEPRRLFAYGVVPNQYQFDGIDLELGQEDVFELLNNTDDGFATLPLDDNGPEPGGEREFKFFDQRFSQVHVSANGLITFVNGSTASNNSDLTSTPAQRTIAVLWDDWDTFGGTNSAVLCKFESSGEGNRVIIEWNNVPHLDVGGNNGATFHAVLLLRSPGSGPEDDDRIELHYKDLDVGNPTYNEGRSATVGLKDVGVQGPNRLLVAFNGGGPLPDRVGSNSAIRIEFLDDDSQLALISTTHRYQTTPHTLTFGFSQNVTGLQPTDLVVTPVGGGTPFSPVSVSGEGTPGATFTFGGAIPEGRFDATIPAGAINSAGGPTSSAFSTEIFFLRGDANHDARVNLADFNILASNFGQSPRDFSQGDFNYDGQVNLADFNVLASRFGQTVAPASTGLVNTMRDHAADDDREDDPLA